MWIGAMWNRSDVSITNLIIKDCDSAAVQQGGVVVWQEQWLSEQVQTLAAPLRQSDFGRSFHHYVAQTSVGSNMVTG